MVGRRVERVEAVVFVLDFGAVGNHETDFAEAAHDVLGDLGERMKFAERAASAGQGEVSWLPGESSLEFEFFTARSQGGFEFRPCPGYSFCRRPVVFLRRPPRSFP